MVPFSAIFQSVSLGISIRVEKRVGSSGSKGLVNLYANLLCVLVVLCLSTDCAMLIDRNNLPKHLFDIPDLDHSDNLCAERVAGPWTAHQGILVLRPATRMIL